jgi:uncharacterized protein (TIGR02246 family)
MDDCKPQEPLPMASPRALATATAAAADESAIRALIEARAEAVEEKDLDALLSHHAPNVLAFDVVDPLQYAGIERVRKRANDWFAIYPGDLEYDIEDLNITAGQDVAFAYYLYRVRGIRIDGARIDMYVRATVCFRRTDGSWQITHEHQSVPFDPDTGKASLDIRP